MANSALGEGSVDHDQPTFDRGSIALVGRPNVGKSTLFNALAGGRDALVVDEPGVTRDRRYGECQIGETGIATLIDTGGLAASDDFAQAVSEQAWQAIDEADRVLFIVDARAGMTADDEDIAAQLRKRGREVTLVVNKCDGVDESLARAEFAALGFDPTLLVAASHRRGLGTLRDSLDALLPSAPLSSDLAVDRCRVAIIGRPNVGKSTLINRLLGEERMLASDVAGTTRDTIEIPWERDGERYTLIDTAGVRRRKQRVETVEKFSIVKSLEAIRRSDVAVLLIDAEEGLATQDLHLLKFANEAGRALVVAMNKWDLLYATQRRSLKADLAFKLKFCDYAQRIPISAHHGSGLGDLLAAVRRARVGAFTEMTTGALNRVLEQAYADHQPPLTNGFTPKLRYAHQIGKAPPTVLIHGSRTKHLKPAYRRYLERRFRAQFDLTGTPLVLQFRDGDNPYRDKPNKLSERQLKRRRRMMKHVKGRKK